MAKIPSIASLERRLAALKARDKAIETRQKQAPKVGTGQSRQIVMADYRCTFLPEFFTVEADKEAVQFFGGLNDLGLQPLDDIHPPLPRGFRPNLIKATRGNSSPTVETSGLTKDKYLKYSISSTGNKRSTYTAPIAALNITVVDRFRQIAKAKKSQIGDYGRIWLVIEKPAFSLSAEQGGLIPGV